LNREDMTCEHCIYSTPIPDDTFSQHSVWCRRTEADRFKGKDEWCGQGTWNEFSEDGTMHVHHWADTKRT
jgi:hypothetical protein